VLLVVGVVVIDDAAGGTVVVVVVDEDPVAGVIAAGAVVVVAGVVVVVVVVLGVVADLAGLLIGLDFTAGVVVVDVVVEVEVDAGEVEVAGVIELDGCISAGMAAGALMLLPVVVVVEVELISSANAAQGVKPNNTPEIKMVLLKLNLFITISYCVS
jgi:hypothetical protein